MPDSPEYVARVRAYTEGQDFVDVQRKTPMLLAELIAGVDDGRLTERPAPDKWSVTEIVTHLAEDEIVSAWRYRQMVENPGVQLAGFDQDLWAKLGKYRERDLADSLELFRLVREMNLGFFEGLSEAQWDSRGVHAERGPTTVRELAKHIAGHDRNHLDQIRGILSGQARKAS